MAPILLPIGRELKYWVDSKSLVLVALPLTITCCSWLDQKKDKQTLLFLLIDKPGTLAQVSAVLGKYKISINRMNQLHHTGETAPILIVTHPTTKNFLNPAINEISNLEICISSGNCK